MPKYLGKNIIDRIRNMLQIKFTNSPILSLLMAFNMADVICETPRGNKRKLPILNKCPASSLPNSQRPMLSPRIKNIGNRSNEIIIE